MATPRRSERVRALLARPPPPPPPSSTAAPPKRNRKRPPPPRAARKKQRRTKEASNAAAPAAASQYTYALAVERRPGATADRPEWHVTRATGDAGGGCGGGTAVVVTLPGPAAPDDTARPSPPMPSDQWLRSQGAATRLVVMEAPGGMVAFTRAAGTTGFDARWLADYYTLPQARAARALGASLSTLKRVLLERQVLDASTGDVTPLPPSRGTSFHWPHCDLMDVLQSATLRRMLEDRVATGVDPAVLPPVTAYAVAYRSILTSPTGRKADGVGGGAVDHEALWRASMRLRRKLNVPALSSDAVAEVAAWLGGLVGVAGVAGVAPPTTQNGARADAGAKGRRRRNRGAAAAAAAATMVTVATQTSSCAHAGADCTGQQVPMVAVPL